MPSKKPLHDKEKTKAVRKKKNPASIDETGGKGPTFEIRVQAAALLRMCLGSNFVGVTPGHKIVKMTFQDKSGSQTDDLVCTTDDGKGHQKKVYYQMKSGLKPTASNSGFGDALAGAWFDYNADFFDKTRDRVVVIFEIEQINYMKGMRMLADYAASSSDVDSWTAKTVAPSVGNKGMRDAFAATKAILSECCDTPPTDDDIFRFLKVTSFEHQDLMSDSSNGHMVILNEIQFSLRLARIPFDAENIWARLVTACLNFNTRGADVTHETLTALDDPIYKAFETIRKGDESFKIYGPMEADEALLALPAIPSVSKQGMTLLSDPESELLPTARASSTNKVITNTLDAIAGMLKEGRFTDAREAMAILGQDLGQLDSHQKARWFSMRATCKWHDGEEEAAATDFIKALELCNDDDKIVAAGIRGHLLRNDIENANKIGQEALERFPSSLPVWIAAGNAAGNTGKEFSESDIPTEFRQDANALQLVAWSVYRSGNVDKAADIARRACKLDTATFFQREPALSYTLESLTSDGLRINFKLQSEQEKGLLKEVAENFEPKIDRLWAIQAKPLLYAAAVNLGFVNLLLGRPEEAIEIAGRLKELGHSGPDLMRLEMEAYLAVGNVQLALKNGKGILDQPRDDVLLCFAHVCASLMDLDHLNECLERASLLPDNGSSVKAAITALQWQTLEATGKSDEALSAIEGMDVESEKEIPLLYQAFIIVNESDREELSKKLLERLSVVIAEENSSTGQYILARAYLLANELDNAAICLERITNSSAASELHGRLLSCYINQKRFTKAKSLLTRLDASWIDDVNFRHMAIRMGQEVGDWDLLYKTAQKEVEQYPVLARSWLLALTAAVRVSSEDLSRLTNEIPEVLEGSAKEISRIAGMEAKSGQTEKAVRRLYRLRRNNMANSEVAGIHLSAHIFLESLIPLLEEVPEKIGSGAGFTIIDATGKTELKAIDPDYIGKLPESDSFFSSDADGIKPFIGKKVGDIVEIKPLFGESRNYTVISIGTSYRYLVQDSGRFLKSAFASPTFMGFIELTEDEKGDYDFTKLIEQVRTGTEAAKQILNIYKEKPITLGILGKLINKSTFDLIMGWPYAATKLDCSGGQPTENNDALDLLQRKDRAFVIDSSTLYELLRIDAIDSLTAISKLYCTTRTLEAIQFELESVIGSKATGSMSTTDDGKLSLIEITENDLAKRADFLRDTLSAIAKYCTVLPAYGPEPCPPNLVKLRELLSEEESSVLYLAAEKGASLLCLDARLRLLARFDGISGIWPQALLTHCFKTAVISANTYAMTTLRLFMAGRSRVAIGSREFVHGLYQGKGFATAMLTTLRDFIADGDVNYEYIKRVVESIIFDVVKNGNLQYGYLYELIEILAESVARHPHCPDNFEDTHRANLDFIFSAITDNPGVLRRLYGAIQAGIARSQLQKKPIILKGAVLFCTQPPFLMNGFSLEEI